MSSEDEAALCERYTGRILAYGLRHLRDRAAAQDLVQHVLMVVLEARRAGRIEALDRLDAYVLGACRHAVYDAQRRERRQLRVAEATRAVLPEGYLPAFAQLDRYRLEQCLLRLEARERSVVLRTFLEQQEADEIGEALELSPGNVRVIRHRALGKLQRCVEGAPA
jgi:RNA polymerase sigma-70 factor (ECF subfamily)